MSDKIALHIDGKRLEKFKEYKVEAGIYTAADKFTLAPEVGLEIPEGALCELYVNDQREMVGISDKIDEFCDKNGQTVSVEGRDLMGLLVDSYVEEFITSELNLKELAEHLLAKTPFIKLKDVVYQAGVVGESTGRAVDDIGYAGDGEPAQLEPGQTIFDVLMAKAVSRGAVFWSNPDGVLVFGRPKAKGKAKYRLVRRRDGRGNNVLEGRRVRDMSRRYSKVVVTGARQGGDELGAEELAREGVATDATVPFHKPFVACDDNNGNKPADQAGLILEHQRAGGLSLIYKVKGHSQNKLNWAINELCEIEDEVLNVHGTFLINNRIFGLKKAGGAETILRLGMPGSIR